MDMSTASLITDCESQPIPLEEVLERLGNIEGFPRSGQRRIKKELISIESQLEFMNEALTVENARCEQLKEQKRKEIRLLREVIKNAKEAHFQLEAERAQQKKERDEGLFASCSIF